MFRVPYTGFMLEWKTVIILVLVILLAICASSNYLKSNKIEKLQNTITINNMNADFALQNAKKDIQKVIEYKTIVEKHYIPQTVYVDNFKKDENETDCHAVARLTNNFVF